jgi:putative nucleotidyltransferase with HDIG domain
VSRNGEPSGARRSGTGNARQQPPTRKLNLPARAREFFWRSVRKVLATDMLWSGALIMIVVLVLGVQRCGPEYERFEVGQRATQDIKAVDDFEFVDARSTDEERQKAVDAVLEIYDHDTERGIRRARQLTDLFERGRAAVQEAAVQEESPAAAVNRAIGERVSGAALEALTFHEFDPALEREMSATLLAVLARKVVTSTAILERETAITLRRIPGERTERVEDFSDFLDLEQAGNEVRQKLAQRLDYSRVEEQALAELAASFVDATVNLNSVATDQERQDAAGSVRSVIRRVKQGDVLAHAGDPLTQDIIDTIEAARRKSNERLGLRGLLGLLFIASTFAFFLYRYTRYHQRYYRKLENLHALLVLMVLSMLALSSAILWIASEVVDNLVYPFNQLDTYTYLIPLGAGAILIALLANGRIATVYSAFAAFLFGAANEWDAHLMVWAMLVQCAGVYAISTYRERAALLRAGLVVGGAGGVAAMALEGLKQPPETLARGLHGAGLAFVGGAIGVGLLISFTLPMLERMFNVLTDIRLLELSNVNNPLLSELAVRAPGSYNHSLVVGTLAEEGARAIGANSLFCRVAAFYHDVGKMNKAEYFVENQRDVNPHDRLSASMSALIIASHVKDGIKLAREAGLPEQMVDIIPQHHGTKLMTFFYEKAKKNADPSLGPVKQEDFRYPGPKPQTREAAIFMLADGVEAAARTIDEPTPNRLKEMIRKVTNSIVLDGQLDSCDLTFVDLDRIQAAFLRALVSMYHHRVDYPGFDFGGSKREAREAKTEPRGEPSGSESRERKVARSS